MVIATAPLIVIGKLAVAVSLVGEVESVAVTTMVAGPAAVGVPVI